MNSIGIIWLPKLCYKHLIYFVVEMQFSVSPETQKVAEITRYEHTTSIGVGLSTDSGTWRPKSRHRIIVCPVPFHVTRGAGFRSKIYSVALAH